MTDTATPAALHAALQERVARSAAAHDVPGIAVGVLHDGVEDYVYHGVTSVENPLDVDASTIFEIGSTTKTYTATALMRLQERGLVDLEERVRRYLPELRLADESVAENVTVRHLVTHTAGWLGDTNEETGEGDDALALFVERLATVPQLSPLGASPSYNNAAVSLAGRVIEVVTGQTYESAITDLVLRPLGMESSHFFARDVMTRRFAVGHRSRDGRVGVARPWGLARATNPAGGIASTAADQIRYARFHLGDGTAPDGSRLLRRETLERMRREEFSLGGGALGDWVGISWLMRDVAGARVVGHGGATNGQTSSFDLVPARGFAVTVLTNADSGGLAHAEISKWALEAYLGIAEPEDTPLALGADELARYAGRYDVENAVIDAEVVEDRLVLNVTYTEAGRKLVMELMGEIPPSPPLPVKLVSPSVFVVVDGEAKGMKGGVLLEEDGSVRALEVGGRLAFRQRGRPRGD